MDFEPVVQPRSHL